MSEIIQHDGNSKIKRIGRILATGGLSLIFENHHPSDTDITLIDSDDQWGKPDAVEAINRASEADI